MDLRTTKPTEAGSRPLPPLTPKQPAKFIIAEATESSKGNPMIKWQVQLLAEEAEGYTCYGNFLTTDVKGAGFSKAHLTALAPALGINLDQDVLDDAELAERLTGLECFVDLKYEIIKDEDPRTGKFTVPRMEVNAAGKEVPAKRAVIKAFYSHSTGGQVTAGLPVSQAPQQQGGYPPYPTQQPQQPVAAQQQQFQQPPMQQQYTQQPQNVPQQQFQQPVQPPASQGNAAVPPWMQQQPQQGGAPVTSETQATGGKRGRGKAG
jgi:hypothetical protein